MHVDISGLSRLTWDKAWSPLAPLFKVLRLSSNPLPPALLLFLPALPTPIPSCFLLLVSFFLLEIPSFLPYHCF